MVRHTGYESMFHGRELADFKPIPRYIGPVDSLIYLQEDKSYRAVRLNAHAVVLMHPQENRPIGVRLNGIRFLNARLKAILASAGLDPAPGEVRLGVYWELARTAMGDAPLKPAEAHRQTQIMGWIADVVKSAPPVMSTEFAAAA